MTRRRAGWLGIVGLALLWSASAGAAGAVGVVIDYGPVAAGASPKFELRDLRDQAGSPVRLGTPVKAGQFIYLDSNGFVTIQMSDGRKVVANTPGVTIVPDSKAMGLLERVFSAWSSSARPRSSQSAATVTRALGSCGMDKSPVLLFLAPLPGSKLVVGKGAIPVAAAGGCGNYIVALLFQGRELSRTPGFAGGMAVLPAVNIGRGRHSLLLRDMGLQEVESWIEGVESRPQMPAELRTGDANLDRIGEALWLAQNAGAEWRLEAARMLMPLVDEGNALARQVALSLVQLAP